MRRDGHVEVDKSYYSIPAEYVGRKVWVRWHSHTVRIFDGRIQQIEFIDRHPIIRSLSDYGELVHASFQEGFYQNESPIKEVLS